MKRILSLFLVSLLLLGCAVPAFAGQTAVELPGNKVARRIREAAGACDDALVTPDLLASITELDLEDCGLTKISFLANAENIQILILYENQITDITALAGLTDLNLSLSGNPVDD